MNVMRDTWLEMRFYGCLIAAIAGLVCLIIAAVLWLAGC